MSDDDLPLDTSHDQYHFIDGALAYAGYHLHHRPAPLHTHSFVEIAFVAAGAGVHHSRAGRHDMQVGDVVLLRPGVWHSYDDCRGLELYNCCFGTELLRHELAWTREDPLLGYLLWTGPYSAQGHGMLRTHLDSAALAECEIHLEALDTLWHNSVPQHRGDIIGRLSLVFGHLGRAVARTHGPLPGPPGPGPPGGRPGHADAGGTAGLRLDPDGAGRSAAHGARVPGPAVQDRHGRAADGVPGPAARRARRDAAPAL